MKVIMRCEQAEQRIDGSQIVESANFQGHNGTLMLFNQPAKSFEVGKKYTVEVTCHE